MEPARARAKVILSRVLLSLGSCRGWVALAIVVLLSVLAVALGSYLPMPLGQPKTRSFNLEARQWAYTPERLRVNKGDRVLIHLEAQDVTHGLYLDGYGQETFAYPDEKGKLEFLADKPGVYRFRCSVTCGPLHPFMIGQLSVEPNTPFAGGGIAILLVAVGAVGWGFWRKANGASG